MDGDGGSERKKQKLKENMKAQTGRGREEDTEEEVVLTTTIEEIRTQDALRSPGVERITTEGNTSWLRDGRNLRLQECNSTRIRGEDFGS